LAKHRHLFGGWVDDGAPKQKRIANISYMYVVGWSANLKWENLEFATLPCRWVSELLEMGNFRVCNISMYAVGECKSEMGKFRVCNILCIWVGANCKLEMGNFGFATFCVCVCVCVFVCANFKREMGNLGFATFYVCIWVGTKLQA
jgi:hypothetical protein